MTEHTTYLDSAVHPGGTTLFTPRCTCGWRGVNATTPDVAVNDLTKHAVQASQPDPAPQDEP